MMLILISPRMRDSGEQFLDMSSAGRRIDWEICFQKRIPIDLIPCHYETKRIIMYMVGYRYIVQLRTTAPQITCERIKNRDLSDGKVLILNRFNF